MDYKEKYEMALEGIQEILSSGQDSIKMSRLQLRLQGIFPELKKSENDTMFEVVKNIIAMTDKVSLDYILNIYGKSKDDIISWIEKQGEQKPLSIVDEWIEDYWNHEKVINPYSYDKGEEIQFDHQGFVRFCKKYCTKPTDKEELTFKVGDWIIRSAEGFKHDIYLVIDVKDSYVCEDLNGERVTFTFNDVHKHFTLWTIYDAKKGDVLYSLDSCRPFIYKDKRPHEQASAYCGINVYGKFFVEYTKDCIIVIDKFVPATKEQRAALFQKMKDAGYKWDSDKKKLKPL